MRFVVFGVAIPKGSTKAFYVAKLGRAITTADNRRSGPWQESVVTAAREAVGNDPPMEGPISVVLEFFLPRPKSAKRSVVDHVKKPDLDKLVRLVKDGMTRAGVYHDDAQVVSIVAQKNFAGGAADPEGARGIPRVLVDVSPTDVFSVAAGWRSAAAGAASVVGGR